MVIKEANAVERKRGQTARKRFCEETTARTQRAKALIAAVKRERMSKDAIERKLDEIFGKGTSKDIEEATTEEMIVERIEQVSKREAQFDFWENMRREAKTAKGR